MVGGDYVLDTSVAVYYWEHPYYPQYLVPTADIRIDALADDAPKPVVDGWDDHRLIRWDKVDRWFEEDEEVFVHPRSPYVRADAVRSARRVRVELDGVVLADASGCVIVFETGLPPRYYIDKTAVSWSMLTPSNTVSECPYKGTTTGYWNATINGETTPDIAWSYDFPTQALGPIAGLVAFYDDRASVKVE